MISSASSPNEPAICINPKNPNEIVGGANINSVYRSTNGGFNWTRIVLTSSTYGVWGDPCVIVDTNQVFYYFHLSNPSSGNWIDRIVCQKSTNAGLNWNNPGSYTYLDPSKQQDKEWAVVNPRNNHIYVTWTEFDSYNSSLPTDSSRIRFAKSTDSGESWISVRRLDKLGGDCIDEDNTVEGAVPTVSPDGDIYVSWSGPLVRNSQFGIFFNKSTDGGNTWLNEPMYLLDQPGGWDFSIPGISRCNGFPVTVCDISGGAYNGNIYINWTDQRNGTNDTDVWFIKSTDGGNTWSEIKKVNDDPPGKHQFLTWMTVDQKTGIIYFVFYDRRNYSDNQTDVFIAKSTDGGETFENIKISANPFLPFGGFFGDYSNISAYDGMVRPIWTRMDINTPSIWTAIIDFPTEIEPTFQVLQDNYNLYQNYPNPFNPSTTINYSLIINSDVSLKVFDQLGKEVVILVSEAQIPGRYSVDFNTSGLSSGIYFYKLTATDKNGKVNFSQTKKMVLLR
jgi:hypothetical protein